MGGLTAALLLRDSGHDVIVYERSAAELEQRGAGIGFLPASSRYLAERAGVDLDEISISTKYIRYLDRQGLVIHEQKQPYRFSNWNTIYRSLLRRFDRERYLLGHECVDIHQEHGKVQIMLADGKETEVDLLVCADGVGSRARSCLLPQVKPQYAGYVAWRGVVSEQDPIPGIDGSVRRGDRLINFVWYRNYLLGGDLIDLMTDSDNELHEVSLPPGTPRPVHIDEMRATAAARLPERIARAVLAVKAPFVQAIFDLEVPQMSFGRVCLLGDAAFVVRPHAAAGTAKAASDAWELARALAEHPDFESALRAWEPGQLELGRNLLARTRRIGRRSQVDCNWTPGDPELIFGLYEPGR